LHFACRLAHHCSRLADQIPQSLGLSKQTNIGAYLVETLPHFHSGFFKRVTLQLEWGNVSKGTRWIASYFLTNSLCAFLPSVFHEARDCNYQDYNISWSPEAIYSHSEFGEGPDGGLFDPPNGQNEKDIERLNVSAGFGIVHQFNDTEEPRLQDGRITDHGVQVIEDFAARRLNGTMDEPFCE
jgi:hypothetical protein